MRLIEFEGRRGLLFEQIERELSLPHVFTVKAADGSGNLSLSGGRDPELALAERDCWSRYLKVSAKDWVVGWQTHGDHVHVVNHEHRGRGARLPSTVLPDTDGLLTTKHDLPLYVTGADCSTVLLATASKIPTVAVVHAGWRGAANGIIANVVKKLIHESGCEPKEIFAGVAPCIGLANFEVGDEVADQVPTSRKTLMNERWHVDLAGWVADQLVDAGLAPDNVEVANMDTVERSDLFFSHRGEGATTGRMGLIAVMRP